MKNYKKVLSLFLCIVIAFASLPVCSAAQSEPQSKVENAVNMHATNSIGELITASFDNNEMQADSLYYVSDLTVNGKTATVEFFNYEACTLVVAVYTDDENEQMVDSVVLDVEAEQLTATATFSVSLPSTFIVKAFLIGDNYEKLSNPYVCRTYTQEFIEFNSKTVYDFDDNRVINFDSSYNNNFAVLNSEVIIVEGSTTNKNLCVKPNADEEVYYIYKIDETVRNLQPGDIFYMDVILGERNVIIKIASISIEGNVATVVGEDTAVEEVFEYTKIDSSSMSSDFTVDDSNASDGVEYVGDETINQKGTITTNAADNTVGATLSKKFKIDKKADDGDGTVTGTINFSVSANLKYYFSSDYKEISFTIEPKAKISLELEGKWEPKNGLKLGYISASPIIGVYISIEPTLTVEFNLKLTISGELTATVGFGWNSDDGFVNKSEWPKWTDNGLEIEGSVFIGIDLKPSVAIISKKIAQLELSSKVGAEIRGKYSPDLTGGSIKHDCTSCIDGDINGKLSLKVTIDIWGDDEFSADIVDLSVKIADFYWCTCHNKFGFGQCPYVKYKVTFTVVDEAGNPISYASVLDKQTDKSGKVVVYLPVGKHDYRVAALAYLAESGTVTIKDKERNIKVILKGGQSANPEYTYIKTGKCGDNLTWGITADGVLVIGGTGAMTNWSVFSDVPWYPYCDSIKSIKIGNGVTTIGDYAFFGCDSLTNVTISDSVTTIGNSVFRECDSLTNVTIPNSVTTIGDYVFFYCDNLTSINVDSDNKYYSSDSYGVLFDKNKTNLILYPIGNTRTSYTIPNGVTTIGDHAFYFCNSLISVTIPDSVTKIDEYAFSACDSLLSVTIPDSVTTIGDYAFAFCNSLTSVAIPDSVTTIGKYALRDCFSLANIKVDPDNKYYSSDSYGVLFNKNQTKLIQYPIGNTRKSYTIPNSVTTIGDSAFCGCNNSLTSITIPTSVTMIGNSAFHSIGITAVYYGGTKSQWEKISFASGNDDLTSATIYVYSLDSVLSLNSVENSIDDYYWNPTVGEKCIWYKDCVAGNSYILLDVSGYYDGFVLDSENLCYIDVVTADEYGEVFEYIVPKITDVMTTTLLIGDFGYGLEQRVVFKGDLSFKEPSVTTLYYGDTLVLELDSFVPPEGYRIEYSIDSDCVSYWIFEDNTTCFITSEASGTFTVTARLVHENGEPALDADGNEIYSEITLKSNAGFFWRIISFFKNLFGIDRYVY